MKESVWWNGLDWNTQNSLEQEAQKNIALHVDLQTEDEYHHAVIHPVWLHPDDQKPRNYNGTSSDQTGFYLDDLQITAQANIKEGRLYAWSVEYKPYTVNLEKAEAYIKTLRKLRKGMEKLDQQFGMPESFGAYVARIASILGAKTAIKPMTNKAVSWYLDGTYLIGTMPDLVFWLKDAEAKWSTKES